MEGDFSCIIVFFFFFCQVKYFKAIEMSIKDLSYSTLAYFTSLREKKKSFEKGKPSEIQQKKNE